MKNRPALSAHHTTNARCHRCGPRACNWRLGDQRALVAKWLANDKRRKKNAVDHTSDHTHPHKENGHAHDHTAHGQGHGQENSIELSENALKNIGYQPVTVALGAFELAMAPLTLAAGEPGKEIVYPVAPPSMSLIRKIVESCVAKRTDKSSTGWRSEKVNGEDRIRFSDHPYR